MSVVTAESRAEADVVQPARGKARFWDREAPLAYIFATWPPARSS